MSNKPSIFGPILMLAVALAPCFGQDQRFIITLKDENFQQLRDNGQLQSSVRNDSAGKIGSILLQHDGTKDQTEIEYDPGFAIDGEKITVIVDERLLAMVKAKPVRMPLPNDALKFRSLIMLYTQSAVPTAPPPGTIVDAKGNELEIVYLTLSNSQVLAGGIEGITSLDLTTEFGDVVLRLSRIAGIRFNIDSQGRATVILKNGDSLTGTLEVPELSLKTEWGLAEVKLSSLESLTITPESRFSGLTTDFGLRWNLELGDSLAPEEIAPQEPAFEEPAPTSGTAEDEPAKDQE